MTTASDTPSQIGPSRRRWSGRTRGGWFGNWLFIQLVRVCGLRLAYIVMAPVAAYFLIAAPKARRSSISYLRRVYKKLPWSIALWGRVYQHMYCYGRILLDRAAALAATKVPFTFELDGDAYIRTAVDQQRGVILLSAHIGCWEVASRAFDGWGVPVHIVAYEGETERINRLLKGTLKHRNFDVIGIDGSISSVIRITNALKRGEIVAMHGDRCFNEAGIPCRILGGQIRLPSGPFLVAALSGSPLIHAFAIRGGAGLYRLKAYPPLYLSQPPKEKRQVWLEQRAQEFADRIECHVRKSPQQWGNFFDYWAAPTTEQKEQ